MGFHRKHTKDTEPVAFLMHGCVDAKKDATHLDASALKWNESVAQDVSKNNNYYKVNCNPYIHASSYVYMKREVKLILGHSVPGQNIGGNEP